MSQSPHANDAAVGGATSSDATSGRRDDDLHHPNAPHGGWWVRFLVIGLATGAMAMMLDDPWRRGALLVACLALALSAAMLLVERPASES